MVARVLWMVSGGVAMWYYIARVLWVVARLLLIRCYDGLDANNVSVLWIVSRALLCGS